MRLKIIQFTAAFAGALLFGSCSSLAPELVGSPEDTGFLAIEGKITKSGLFTGGAMFSKKVNHFAGAEILSPDNQVIEGDPFIYYMIFSNLKPGKYRILRAGGNPYFKPDVEIPDHDIFKFTIEAGKATYVGVLEIGSFDVGLPGGLVYPGDQKIGTHYTVEKEMEAWEYLSDLYSDTAWGARMKAQLAGMRK